MPALPSLLSRTLLAGLLLADSRCRAIPTWPGQESEPTAPASPAAPAPTTETSPSQTLQTCEDWSGLDRDELAALPPSRLVNTLDEAWHTLLARHPDPTFNCLDWPAVRQRYGERLAETRDLEESYALVRAMLAELGQTHLTVVPPTSVPPPPAGPALLPVEVRWIGGALVVTDASRHGLGSGVPAGATLVALDDQPLDGLVAQARQVYDRDVEVAGFVREAVDARLTCTGPVARRVRYRRAGADRETSSVLACVVPDAERMTMGDLRDVPVELEATVIPGTRVGLVRFNVWMLPLMPRLEAALAGLRAKGIEGLVLDLRGNEGGMMAMAVPLVRHFITAPLSLGTLRTRQTQQRFEATPQADPFTGPIAILVDEATASTSEVFAQALREAGRATIFGGGPSQGAALPIAAEKLPEGALLRYIVGTYTSAQGHALEGQGVSPDVVVIESPRDFAAGHDPVLDAAVQSLARGNASRPSTP